MRKNMIALAFFAAVMGHAQAQNTDQAWQFRYDSCQVVAKRAKNAWGFREIHRAYPMHVIQKDSPISVLHLWAVDYATNQAGSEDEAVKVSFAKCMDNIDRVYREARYGTNMSMADLQ